MADDAGSLAGIFAHAENSESSLPLNEAGKGRFWRIVSKKVLFADD
jgi:hypothetical protein